MLIVCSAAILLGLVAPILWSLIWRVPFSFLSVATVLRTAITTALTTLLFGGLAYWALHFVSTTEGARLWVAGITAFVCGSLLLITSARRLRVARALALLCQRAQEKDVRDRALTSIASLLGRVRRKSSARHANLVLLVTGPLSQAQCWDRVCEFLNDIDPNALDDRHNAIRAQALATSELYLGNANNAELAIQSVRRPAEPEIEVWLLAAEAWLRALQGDARFALAHVGQTANEDDPSVRASHRIIRAHAFASKGETERAKKELNNLLREAGRDGVERVALPEGPASPLAIDKLASEDRPNL